VDGCVGDMAMEAVFDGWTDVLVCSCFIRPSLWSQYSVYLKARRRAYPQKYLFEPWQVRQNHNVMHGVPPLRPNGNRIHVSSLGSMLISDSPPYTIPPAKRSPLEHHHRLG
jgi:hypothetical protein